ncbi:MAG: NAD-dependent epimerase/dehydratase family protein [Planctomycetia bacterium]|nr:NAD-dependent epimerase/dehydratase family protein [Planctomycetia bacterium]
MPNTRLIVGCGYLGRRVAELWRDAGDDVSVTTRSPQRAALLRADGFQVIEVDITQPEPWPALPAATTVLFAIGFDRHAGHAMRTVYVDGLRRALAMLPAEVGRFIYISSTGVYGQSHDEIVDEDSPTEPTREGGRICLEAESWLRRHPLGERAVILRLAGIYGPGRIPRLAAIRAGEPLALPTEGYLNLIHVEDAARIVLLAAEFAQTPRTYLVSDGHPLKRSAYYNEVARRLNAPRPEYVEPDVSAAAASRAESSKRLDIRRLLTELPLTLKYPNYKHGLKAILADEARANPVGGVSDAD